LIGALFDEGDDAMEAAFRHGIDMINADRSVLVRTRLIAHIEKIAPGDSFTASKQGKVTF
jgi:ionotropic glutamate receptor